MPTLRHGVHTWLAKLAKLAIFASHTFCLTPMLFGGPQSTVALRLEPSLQVQRHQKQLVGISSEFQMNFPQSGLLRKARDFLVLYRGRAGFLCRRMFYSHTLVLNVGS